jgi:glycosyltransferase involved in cell wall biosynthesis
VDGPGRTILETAARIDRTRIDYHVGVLVGSADGKHQLVEALDARGVPVHHLTDRPGIDKAVVADIVRLMEALDIDVLHSSEFRSNVLSLLAARARRVKRVATVHGWIANDPKGRIYRLVDKALLRTFDKVVLVSHATRKLVPRWWLPDSRVQVLHNGLMLDSYGAEVVTAARPVRDVSRGASLINIGRLSPEKGQPLLLQAVAALAREYPQLRLTFAGIGPLEQSLRDQAQALGIADRVTFLGYVADMPRVYADTDLVVQSSLTEGLPNVILEAAYLRVPILATAVGGTAEVVEHGRSAWLIRPGSAALLEQGLRQFMRAPQKFAEMAAVAHERIRTHFSFEARTRKLIGLYESLLTEST